MKPDFNRNYKGIRFRVCLLREGGTDDAVKICNSDAVYDLVKEELQASDREIMLSIMLTTKNDLIGVETIAVGGLNSLTIIAREVFKSAILANAASIILCHNHPSGETEPSAEDINITRLMMDSGKILGINLFDHIIVGHNSYKSLRDCVDFPK